MWDEKFSGTVLEDKESKKYFNPQLNKPRINFAAPSDKILVFSWKMNKILQG